MSSPRCSFYPADGVYHRDAVHNLAGDVYHLDAPHLPTVAMVCVIFTLSTNLADRVHHLDAVHELQTVCTWYHFFMHIPLPRDGVYHLDAVHQRRQRVDDRCRRSAVQRLDEPF